ncbi:CASP-like protein 2A1 [Zingiber officinale]|uniref:CASP-like protein 2A1 n=1 Tax=Zingiber officinale TaxID=94328 RepID=UPI001C4B9E4B|nr:CASP-like protein 2A1 [Zingiber officinale]
MIFRIAINIKDTPVRDGRKGKAPWLGVLLRHPSSADSACSWTVFLLDQLMTYIILVAGTVSTEILYLAYKGDVNVTWSEACSVLDTFCRRATTSVGITFGSTVCYVLLSLVSSYRLFSTFAAPLPFLSSKSQEIAAFPS